MQLKTLFILGIAMLCAPAVWGQMEYIHEPSAKNPYGTVNPKAPKEMADFAPLIGTCDCKSQSKASNGTWFQPVNMTWTFKYIMNGMAIQDETLKADSTYSGSIRQFNPETQKWNVHYYSAQATPSTLSSWEGGKKENGDIVLYRRQPSPDDTPGYFRITFSEISKEGFKWVGEWTTLDESFTYLTWRIDCKKRKPAK
jgi:hypothetical protein